MHDRTYSPSLFTQAHAYLAMGCLDQYEPCYEREEIERVPRKSQHPTEVGCMCPTNDHERRDVTSFLCNVLEFVTRTQYTEQKRTQMKILIPVAAKEVVCSTLDLGQLR
jgi:hypothetical protein